MKLADFQRKTADRIYEVFHSGQRRVLLADEVGLGKTIVASAVVEKVGEWHKTELHDDHFKVVYICSNISIASQNVRKLGIKDQLSVSESRLSMQHLKIYESAGTGHAYSQLIPLTPATSFSMTSGCGNQAERALMYAHLRRLPAFAEYQDRLSAFLAYDAEKWWQSYIDWYEKKTTDCDQNGSHYIEEMAAALTEKLNAQPDLVPAIKANCDSTAADRRRKSRPLINALRMIFAEISLAKLEPDLVIMDECQRFRDLIAPPKDSEEKLLSQQFLQDTSTKVLLLSATPYKPYSTLEEIAEDESSDHYHEFTEVMDFLFYDEDQRRKFHTVWRDYSSSLCEISSDNWTVLVARKNEAEKELYQGICRTERFNTGIIDDSGVKEIQISSDDVLSCHAMQTLMDTIEKQDPKALHWRTVPIDYVKSSPYLLSFMENYQLKKQIREFCIRRPDFLLEQNADEKYLLLKKAAIHHYRPIRDNNARLKALKEIVFSDGKLGAETLLWIPPSNPYYRTGSVFDRNRDFSKVLVFSSWEMVPRMISVMLSYEAERLTIGKLFNSAKSHRGRGYFATREERRFGIGRLKYETEEIICLVSDTLAALYRPTEWIGSDLKTIRRGLQAKLIPLLEDLKRTRNISEDPKGGAGDLVRCIRAIDGDVNANPTEIPQDAVERMAEMAIASPAICVYRVLQRLAPNTPAENAMLAGDIAKDVFISMFNKAESSAILDLLYGQGSEEAYYENVFRYCAEGNLQAVLDEYAHVLNLSGADLKDAIIEGTADTVSLPVDTQEGFPGRGEKMRSHFAVGYYNAKASDETVARVDRIRKAFNSPFRPFVLSTTSIGQEGLDFHSYCRKVMHWNLPSNPIDLEQREGRINRYKCLAVRQNIARKYGAEISWDAMFERAAADLKGNCSDLVPYWCLPDMDGSMVKIERIVPMYPYSQDQMRYDRIIKILSLYRLTLGQPRQEELISILDAKLADGQDSQLFMNLSPFDHDRRMKMPPEGDQNMPEDHVQCPEDYTYYYVECRDIVGRTKDSVFCSEIFDADEGWKYDSNHEISDRIMGYQPGEDPGWGIGDRDIMAEICKISRDEALQHILRKSGNR